MASHAGLVLVFETRDGYIDVEGRIIEDIEKARKVSFYQTGFSSAYHVFKKLGYSIEGLGEDDIKLSIYEPSYDSRIGILESIYKSYGYYDNRTCLFMAETNFKKYHLEDYSNFQMFQKFLEENALEFLKKQVSGESIALSDSGLSIYPKQGFIREFDEIICSEYYSTKGTVYSYKLDMKNPHVEKYFDCSMEEQEYFNHWQSNGLASFLREQIMKERFSCRLSRKFQILEIKADDDKLSIYTNETSFALEEFLSSAIRSYYSSHEMHITRMFGSYILLQRRNDKLEAVKATPIPIQYCPLMVKLLKEVGGDYAEVLLETLKTEDQDLQARMMCQLINEVVIKGGYFDTSRPLNSCEANVLFGASEIMSSAFKSNLIEAAVIVSNNLGTIITTNDSNTQGAVKRMTGLFYTSPSKEILKTAKEASIISVFPISAKIDQLEGVKKAIALGYKKIAVSVAATDNILHEQLEQLEENDVQIYRFGLCSTGISEEVARSMQNHADVIWSCASKYVKELIEPNAIAQVGLKIPVHIMTKDGWELVRNHLLLNGTTNLDEELVMGDEKPVYLNDKGKLKVLKRKEITSCSDCPHPCI